MNNLEKQLNNEILHENDSKSALSVIKVQFDKFKHSDMLKSSSYESTAREARQDFKDYTQMEAKFFKDLIIQHMESIEQCIVERAHHEQEIHNKMKRLNERKFQIQECMVQKDKASDASSGEKDYSRIASDKGNDQGLENQSNTYGDEEPMVEVPYTAEYNVFAVDTQHYEQPECIIKTCIVEKVDSNVILDSPDMCDNEIQTNQNAVECYDERAALANLNGNLKLDIDENKKIQKQLRIIDSRTERTELEKYMAFNDRTFNYDKLERLEGCDTWDGGKVTWGGHVRVYGTVPTKQAEFEKYKAFNDRTVDYDKLERKLNEALGQLAHKDTVIREEREQYFEIQDLKAQLQDKNIAICKLKKLIEKSKGNFMDTKFDRPSVVRQPNVQRIPKLSVLGKPASFSNSLDRIYFQKTKSVPKANVSEGLSKPVTTQTLPQAAMKAIVQLILFIVDSGCTKHMTGNLKLMCNFVEKFLRTVRFGNDQFVPILGYGDLVQGNVMINRVYYVKGLNHNLFFVGQFVTWIWRLLSGSLHVLLEIFKATPTQAWLWHRRLSHLNFDYINLLSKKDIVIGIPKLKYVKDQLCSSCELSKAKRSSFKSKAVPSSKGRLNLLYMDLCGPMQRYHVYNKRTRMIVESIHIRFDELKEVSETSVANNTSGLVPQRQKASDYDNPDPVPQRQDVSSSANADVPSQQELDLLFGPLYDKFFNAGSNPSTNVQSTLAPTTYTHVHAEENNNDQAEGGEPLQDD
nr:hypothetical protein [Tanacetum cinerariifolium]